MSDFGELLKSLRLGANLTQEQLGNKIYVSKSMISYYEHSLRYPSSDTLMRIAEVFNVSVDYLMEREKEERTLNLSGLSDRDIEFLESVAIFLRQKNGEQTGKNEKERPQKKSEKRNKDTTANF